MRTFGSALLAIGVCSFCSPAFAVDCEDPVRVEAGIRTSPDNKFSAEIDEITTGGERVGRLRMRDAAHEVLYEDFGTQFNSVAAMTDWPFRGTWSPDGRFFVYETSPDIRRCPYRDFSVFDTLKASSRALENLEDIAVSDIRWTGTDTIHFRKMNRDAKSESDTNRGTPASFSLGKRVDFLCPRTVPFKGRFELSQRTISPDGSADAYFYCNAEAGIYLRAINSPSTGTRLLTTPRWAEPVWSPDSRFLAIMDHYDGHQTGFLVFEVSVAKNRRSLTAKFVFRELVAYDEHLCVTGWDTKRRVRVMHKWLQESPSGKREWKERLETRTIPKEVVSSSPDVRTMNDFEVGDRRVFSDPQVTEVSE